MRRRQVIKLLGGAAAAWPLAARAQQSERVRRIVIVMGFTESDPAGQAQVNAFRQQLRKLGWIEGVNIHIDYRYPADDLSRIRAVAAELSGSAPDLIVSSTNLVTAILKSEVRAVPLVFLYVSDPIGSGFVTNLARPTGNVTGFANFEPSMGGKWLERLKEIAPHIERVGFILNPETPPNVNHTMRQRRYLPLDVWPSRQARNAAAACSRSSALLNLRRGCFGGSLATSGLSLRSSTPCRRMRLRLAIRVQFARTITPPPSTSAKPPGR